MRRRSLKHPGSNDPDDSIDLDEAAAREPGAAEEPWEGRWGKPEEERVAQWLRSKIRPALQIVEEPEDYASPGRRELGAVHVEESRRTVAAGTRYEAEAWQLDQQRRKLAAAVDAERAQAERVRREQLDAWARLELEMSELDKKRRRLAEAVEAERAEVERVRQEQQDARARLEAAVAELDDQRANLMAVEAERSEAERARREHADARAALAAEVASIDEQRRRLTAAVEAERAEAERVRRAHTEARARLEAEMVELDAQRRRVNEAVEAERTEAERVRAEQLEAKARLEAEIIELDRKRQRLVDLDEVDLTDGADSGSVPDGYGDRRPPEPSPDSGPSRRRRPAGPPRGPVRTSGNNVVTLMAGPSSTPEPRWTPVRSAASARYDDADVEVDPEESRARLASAVAELARHVATTHSAQRLEAEQILERQMEARVRLQVESAEQAAQRRRAAEALEAARATVGRKRRWVVRVLVAVVLLVPVGLELASPILARSRLARVADDAAASAALGLSHAEPATGARAVAQAFADTEGVQLVDVVVDGTTVRVTLAEEASSVVLGRWGPLRGWYDVEATGAVTATPATRAG